MSVLLSAAHAGLTVLADIPNPGQGNAPPGSGGLTKILGWLAWGVFACCVAGLLLVAGKMALAHHRRESMEVTGGVVLVLVATAIAGSASAIVGAVLAP